MTYKKFKNLDFLDISFNQIGQSGFEYLINYYIDNPDYIPNELLIRGLTLDQTKHLPLIKEFLSVTKHTFKKLNLKPNNLRNAVKNKFKSELNENAWKILC